jgi:formyltetrahydrofolate deformylase
VVAAVSHFLFDRGANIIHSNQHSTERGHGTFLMRIEFQLAQLASQQSDLEQAFKQIAGRFGMQWRITGAARKKRLAVFVSRQEHALLELLWQQRAGDLAADIVVVVSNHPTHADLVERQGIPYVHIPVTSQTKASAEQEQLRILGEYNVDAVVLARYMQVLSPRFLQHYPARIINIHHSFLPAFVGANPYQAAYDRGVKLIGATAHYVTEELDAGPIIEQDVLRIDHRHDADELRRLGRFIERVVLARAVGWHCEDRVLLHGNKTIVFN